MKLLSLLCALLLVNEVASNVLVSSNFCQQPLTEAQCRGVAVAADTLFQLISDHIYPYGCFIDTNGNHFYNEKYTDQPCSASYRCVCSSANGQGESTPAPDSYDCNYIQGVNPHRESGAIEMEVAGGSWTKDSCQLACVTLRNSGMKSTTGAPESSLINGVRFSDTDADGFGTCYCQQRMITTVSSVPTLSSCYLVKNAAGGENGLVHDTDPTGSVTCDEAGFQPDFDLAFQAGTTVRWKVQIGDDVGDDRCNSVSSTAAGKDQDDGQLVTDLTNGDIEYTAFTSSGSFIPYSAAAGDNPTCYDPNEVNPVTFEQDATHITYTAKIRVTITETIRHMIERKRMYKFDLECKMTRSVQESSDSAGGWTTSGTLTPDTSSVSTVENTFDFPIALEVHPDDTYNQDQTTSFEKAMGEDIYVKMYEETTNPLFKFKATRCFFTDTSAYDDNIKDVWFDNGCPVDKTSSIVIDNTNTNDEFALKIKAFQFVTSTSNSIFVHCDITLCLQGYDDAECVQETQDQCDGIGDKKRKRRSPFLMGLAKWFRRGKSPKDSGIIEHRQLTVEKPILIGVSQVITPTCSNNFVYDRVSRKCSSDNILQVDRVYLDIPWREELADPSSQAFQDFAQSVGYELYALMQYSSEGIRGVKVIAARKGSVILTIQVIYSAHMDHSEAFNAVEQGIRGTAQTRLAQILNIRQEKIIEYIVVQPHSSASSGIDQMTLIIIVVVAVLIAVLFISSITIWKVSKSRGVNHVESPAVKSYDNPAM